MNILVLFLRLLGLYATEAACNLYARHLQRRIIFGTAENERLLRQIYVMSLP